MGEPKAANVPRDPGGTPRHFVRIVFSGIVLTGAIGLPSMTASSTLSTSGIGVWVLVKAALSALASGAIAAAITRRLVREIWTGWVGMLGGVVPASLVAEPSRQRAAAVTYALGGLALAVLGTFSLRTAQDSGSVIFSFYGLVTVVIGIAIAIAGAIPRLVFARRRKTPTQPDEAITRHVWLFLTLVLGALGLSSGLAETMPEALHGTNGIPLRPGNWMRGCVSTLEFEDTPCPLERRYRIVAADDRDVRLEWEFPPGRCEVVVDDGERPRVFDDDAGWLTVHLVAGHDVVVAFVGKQMDACWYRVRMRPPREQP
jgi:hypothetical protein